jgi:hypothetical protein
MSLKTDKIPLATSKYSSAVTLNLILWLKAGQTGRYDDLDMELKTEERYFESMEEPDYFVFSNSSRPRLESRKFPM